MKLSHFATLAVALLFADATVASHKHSTSHHHRNLLDNPSFEDNESGKPWKTIGHGVKILKDKHLARTGRRSAVFEIKNRTQHPEINQFITGIKRNKSYLLKFYFAVPKGNPADSDNCRLKAQLYGDFANTITFLAVEDGLPRNYQKQEFVFTGLDKETRFEVFVFCEVDQTEKLQVVFDDFSIVEVDS